MLLYLNLVVDASAASRGTLTPAPSVFGQREHAAHGLGRKYININSPLYQYQLSTVYLRSDNSGLFGGI
eukprot:SAG31_NODE_5527_length_2477_cov_1.710681_2_plen_69_part_00